MQYDTDFKYKVILLGLRLPMESKSPSPTKRVVTQQPVEQRRLAEEQDEPTVAAGVGAQNKRRRDLVKEALAAKKARTDADEMDIEEVDLVSSSEGDE